MHSIATPLVGLTVVLASSSALAENMMSTRSQPPGYPTLGAEIQAETRQIYMGSSISVQVHESIGLVGGLDLFLRQGFYFHYFDRPLGTVPVYLGGGVKWTFLHLNTRKGHPGLALYGGGHFVINSSYGGADLGLIIDYRWGRWRPYAALDSEINFGNRPSFDFRLGLIAGLRIYLVSHFAWFIELGGGVSSAGPSGWGFVSTGPQVYI